MVHGEPWGGGPAILSADYLNFREKDTLSIKIESWSNAARLLQVRGYCKENLISHDHTTNSDRSKVTTTFEVADFPLHFMIVTTSAGVRRGALYVRATLQMGGFDVGVLVSGYVTDDYFPCYPNGRVESMADGPGLIRTITGTDPAAGVEISETVPTNARWKLRAARITLVTDATVANRRPRLVLDDGTTAFQNVPAGVVITAGLTRYVTVFGGPERETTMVSDDQILPIPDLTLAQGYRIRTSTEAIQAGDNYEAMLFTVEEWIEE